ncbi:MAG: hypothetical protein ACRDRU_09070 [Pseudonocardiaceae bacterium]
MVVMGRAYRIRVYGKPRKNMDPHQMAQALLMLARELHEQQLEEQASRQASQPGSEPRNGG